MAWRELVNSMRMAAADAERADRLYRDPAFREQLAVRPQLALQAFETYAVREPLVVRVTVRARKELAA